MVFDVALLEKPVIYYHFDKEDFFTKQWQSGYFDYEKHGFGELCYELDSLLDALENAMQNDCKMSEKYLKRVQDFFTFRDGFNCKRLHEAILNLDR